MNGTHVKLAAALAAMMLVPTHFAAMRSSTPAQAAWKGSPQSATALELPITFERRVGDLDGMAKRHRIRALVVHGRSSFFYDKGQPEGIYYEAFNEFQRFANQKLKIGDPKIAVIFIPVRPEQLEQARLLWFSCALPDNKSAMLYSPPTGGSWVAWKRCMAGFCLG
jgi:hypothetical protein